MNLLLAIVVLLFLNVMYIVSPKTNNWLSF